MSSRGSAPLLIFPCNGNGLEALDCLGQAWHCIGFVDDTPQKQAAGAFGYPVFPRSALAEFAEARVLAVPGGPTSYLTRRNVIESLNIAPARFARVIHPAAHVSARAELGENVLVAAGVVITSNAVVGSHVCLMPNSVVHHDSVVRDWTLVGSSVTVAGSVIVGENCYIGSGSSIIHGIRIGDGALVSIGSNVIRDVAPDSCVGGNPAHFLFPLDATSSFSHRQA
jgi:sugar O-acyltransferase (sialic acid O-acetyltransferase NeuD family)